MGGKKSTKLDKSRTKVRKIYKNSEKVGRFGGDFFHKNRAIFNVFFIVGFNIFLATVAVAKASVSAVRARRDKMADQGGLRGAQRSNHGWFRKIRNTKQIRPAFPP